jgi:putative addiction module component (TIGR02574 family)
MAQSVPNPPPGFDELSLDEKLDYVESLWDQVVERAQIPVPEWHLELLRERLEAFRSSPSTGRPWKEVREELRRKYQLPSDG